MSVFSVQINFLKQELFSSFLKEIAEIIANAFHQPVNTVCGGITENTYLSWRGSVDPVVFLIIQSTHINPQENNKCTKVLSDYIHDTTFVPLDRIIISYTAKVVSDFVIDGHMTCEMFK